MATKTKSKSKSKAKQETVVLSVLIDESGSMGGKQQSVIESYNEFIESMRNADEAKGKDVRATLAMFDSNGMEDNVRIKHDAVPVGEVPELGPDDYQPRGGTPLNDAIVATVSAINDKAPDRALVVIVTDGMENSSETSTEDVRKLVVAKEAEGWRFIYMGANVDSFAEGGARGLAPMQNKSFTSTVTGTRAASGQMVNSGVAYLSDAGTLDRYSRLDHEETGGVTPDAATPDEIATMQAEQSDRLKRAQQETKDKAKESAAEASTSALDALKGE